MSLIVFDSDTNTWGNDCCCNCNAPIVEKYPIYDEETNSLIGYHCRECFRKARESFCDNCGGIPGADGKIQHHPAC